MLIAFNLIPVIRSGGCASQGGTEWNWDEMEWNGSQQSCTHAKLTRVAAHRQIYSSYWPEL